MMRLGFLYRYTLSTLVVAVGLYGLYFLSKDETVEHSSHPVVLNTTVANAWERESACFLILVRNREIKGWMVSMKQVESQFNWRYNYPYVFLNDEPFTEDFKKKVRGATNATVEFGLIRKEHWSYPNFINQTYAAETRKKASYIYGKSESYRHMCRFESGFFFRHPLALKYKYYWRVEPNVKFYCQMDYDPFRFLRENDKLYSFTITLLETIETVPSLWSTVQEWLKTQEIPKDNAMDLVSNNFGQTYNLCHFWSNFEIASFDLWRHENYLNFFNHLDNHGGFFYERWGDAPVHSIYASIMLPRSKLHFFDEIGYRHDAFGHCPKMNQKCSCDPKDSVDDRPYSCIPKWKWITKNDPKPLYPLH